MSGRVRLERVEVGGWEKPHELKIELVGRIDETVDDGIVRTLRGHAADFLREVGPVVEAAFERWFLGRGPGGAIEDIEI